MHNQLDLLRNAVEIDMRLKHPGATIVLPDHPIGELLPKEEDQFGGNENNRRVAAKKAKQTSDSPSALKQPSLTGDPAAAAEAIRLDDAAKARKQVAVAKGEAEPDPSAPPPVWVPNS